MQYTITNTGHGWLLKIWEPYPAIGDRTLPFLYQIKTIHPTKVDAEMALNQHLGLNSSYFMLHI